jgi:DNA polymerase-1
VFYELTKAAQKRLVLIDGKSIFYRGYYAMPNLSTKDGTPTGGVYGFASLSLEVIKRLKPDFVAVAWDKPKTNIRKRLEIYPDYKAGRKPAPADFYAQIPILHELLESLGWPLYELDDYEADDIMATLAFQADKEDIETILITSDLDALQCLSENTKVYALKKGLSNIEEFHPESFREKYGLETDQFLDLKSLQGDSSDNIPGVPGVGAKTASVLLQKYKTLDGVYDKIEEISGSVKQKLIDGRQLAYMSKELAQLYKDAPIKLDLESMDVNKFNGAKLRANLEKLEFKAILRSFGDLPLNSEAIDSVGSQAPSGTLELPAIVSNEKFEKSKISYVYSICKDVHCNQPVALLVGNGHQVTLFENFKNTDTINNVLDGVSVVGYDIKKTLKLLFNLGINNIKVEHDVQIANFLINSLDKTTSLSELSAEKLNYNLPAEADIPPEDIGIYTAEYIGSIISLYSQQTKLFTNEPKLNDLAKKIEWPVIPVIAKMEIAGIKVSKSILDSINRQLEDYISDLEQTIYGYAEQEFNIASPQQLADILFVVLGLPTVGIKKGKTGYSTAANELDKLKEYHPIIDSIIQFREYAKLKNTYLDTLPRQIGPDGRIHTLFNITVAPTGRLSSVDPNLQNIPIKSEAGRAIRSAFIPENNHVFISADYSQFELRLAAVLAGDEDMIETFNSGEDIHTRTAAEVYGVALDDVTSQMRSAAKTINFGVLYGMSPHGLSVATGMKIYDAKNFIDRYFASRKPLVEYIENIKKLARTNGFVETFYGRRRPMPEINSPNFIIRSSAERQAVNLPIQGTEADIMKKAMVAVENILPTGSRQLLQIHDSILVETPVEDSQELAKIIKKVMEDIAPEIKIKLAVDVKIGSSWSAV